MTREVKIRVILTGHYEDRCHESSALVFDEGDSDEVLLAAMVEFYSLDPAEYEPEPGDTEPPLPAPTTWEELEGHIGDYAWWRVEEHTVKVGD